MLSLITIVRDRPTQLGRLLRAAARAEARPDEIVVVDMGSTAPAVDPDPPGIEVVRTTIGRPGDPLPLAAARNHGAATARGDQLVFLDVDCIPGAELFAAYRHAIGRGGLVCGPVRYLERHWEVGLAEPHDDAVLAARSSPHPVRLPPEVEHLGQDHERFWSLSFGLDRATWDHIGGFDEAYVGYGAEDTDFAFRARSRGVPMRWRPDGPAFHQWHRSEAPPVGHLHSIVANATTFRHRWDRWPMEGWLAAFADRGLVTWDPAGDHLALTDADRCPARPPLRVLSIPSSHPYPRKVLPPEVEAAADPTEPWWPHRAFDPDWLAPVLEQVDVVHVHFGFDHLDPDRLGAWARSVRRAGVPLVVTVHDLHSPHEADPEPHRHRLAQLLGAADAVVTLTDSAAAELSRMGFPPAAVIPHPHVGPREPISPHRSGPRRVGVHLKAGRANLVDPAPLLFPLRRVAEETGCSVHLRLDDHAPAALRRAVAAEGRRLGLELEVAPRLDDAQLLAHLDGLDVSVLPYAFGTHSGWLELCRDRGVRVVAPSVGCYRDQWDEVDTFDVVAGRVDAASLERALRTSVGRPRLDPRDEHQRRTEELAAIHEAHRRIYRGVRERRR